MKILLLEDDLLLNESITQYLSTIGHAITSVRDGQECLDILEKNVFDFLILDINVPSVDGLSILERLHEQKRQIPAIYISTLIDIEDISRAFNLGCYDYLKKPFHLKELHIRINKIIQTSQLQLHHKRLSKSYSFDGETYTLLFKNEPQTLAKRQLKIIELLAKNRGMVCSYELFMDYVWDDMDVDLGTIRAEVNRLKNHLKEDFIFNVRGIGYMIKTPD